LWSDAPCCSGHFRGGDSSIVERRRVCVLVTSAWPKNEICVNWSRIYEVSSRDVRFSLSIGGRSSWALGVGFDSATIILYEPDGRALAEIRAENLENFK
jgi:hypothetical protein